MNCMHRVVTLICIKFDLGETLMAIVFCCAS